MYCCSFHVNDMLSSGGPFIDGVPGTREGQAATLYVLFTDLSFSFKQLGT